MDAPRVSSFIMFPFRGVRQEETPTPQLWSGNILSADVMLGQISRRKTTDSEQEDEEEERREGDRRRASHNPLMRSRHVPFERGNNGGREGERSGSMQTVTEERREIVRLEQSPKFDRDESNC